MSIYSFDENDRMTSVSKAPGVKVDEELGSVSSMLVSQIQKDLTAIELADEHADMFDRALFPPDRLTKKHEAMANPPRPAQFTAFGLGLMNLNVRLKIYSQILVSLMQDSERINQASVIGGAFLSTAVQTKISSCVELLKHLNKGIRPDGQVKEALADAMKSTDGVTVERTPDGFRISNVARATSNSNIHGPDAVGGMWNCFRTPPAAGRGSKRSGTVYVTPNGVGDFHTTGSNAEFEKDPANAPDGDVSNSLRAFYFGGYSSNFGKTVHAAMENLHKVLFGDVPSKANIKAKSARFGLDVDFSSLDDYLYAIPGVRDALGGMRIFSGKMFDGQVIDNMGSMFRVELRRVPSPNLARRIVATKSGNTNAGAAQPLHRMADFIMPYCGFAINVGYSVELPNKVVDYILQSEDHSAGSLLLVRWFDRWVSGFMRMPKTSGAPARSTIPRCLSSSTQLPRLTEMRRKLGFKIEESLGDENGVTVNGRGNIVVMPRAKDINLEAVAKLEKEISDRLEERFRLGLPLNATTEELRVANAEGEWKDDQPAVDIDAHDRDFQTFSEGLSNSIIGVDPSSGLLLTTGSNYRRVEATIDEGAVAPSTLEIADALGYDFAREGDSENVVPGNSVLARMIVFRNGNERNMTVGAFSLPVVRLLSSTNGDNLPPEVANAENLDKSWSHERWESYKTMRGGPLPFFAISILSRMFLFLRDRGLARPLDTLIEEAKAMQLSYSSEFDPAAELDTLIDSGLYEERAQGMNDAEYVAYMAATALLQASGILGGRLFAEWTDTDKRGLPAQAAREEMMNDWRYVPDLIGHAGGLHRFGNIRGWLGGALLTVIAREVFTADRKKVFTAMYGSSALGSSSFLTQTILPLAFMIGNAVPDARKYIEQAKEHVENSAPNDSLTPEDLVLEGTKDHTMMPHQFNANKQLAKSEPPRYALLDISPGGGKTFLGIRDILWCASVMKEPVKPAVIAPSGLVGNWCEDLALVTDDWNVVPITTQTVKEWGLERIQDLLANSPSNTIFVIGISFLTSTSGHFTADVGGARVQIMAQLEFLKRFGFNYCILDESHKAKGRQSLTHRAIKKMFLQTSMKYKRLATGTLVPDRVSDVVGQAALFTPGIFGDGSNIQDAARTQDDELTRDAADAFNKAVTVMKARFGNYATLATYKRKEWAFMLPTPIETFLTFEIGDESLAKGASLHEQAYQAIYQAMAEEALKEVAEERKNGGEDEDEESKADSDSDADSEDDDEDAEARDTLGDDGANSGSLGQALRRNTALNAYYQRMEQMLTDPMGDQQTVEIFEAAGFKGEFIPVKVRVIIERVKKHFLPQDEFIEPTPPDDPEERKRFDPNKAQMHQVFKWKAGVRPFEMDIAIYDGKRYLARKQQRGVPTRYRLPESKVPPPQDPEYWKEEAMGKVLILCRYDRSGDAIMRALKSLAPDLAKYAIRFSGKSADKESAIDKFKTDPSVRIMVANEQVIAEGYNMQQGSRVIRCDTPWSPGIVRQSHARIMRPDPKAAVFDDQGRPGDLKREVIFIDWIMTENTMEVVKVARVTCKEVKTTIFEEEDNPRYDEIRKWAQLAEPPYSPSVLVDPTFINSNSYLDPENPRMQHFLAKKTLNEIDHSEFAEMRETTAAQMQSIKGKAKGPNFGKIIDRVPFVANQRINDRWGYDLVLFREWYKSRAANTQFPSDPKEYRAFFDGTPVLTEWGEGIIVGMTTIDAVRLADPARRQQEPCFKSLRVLYPDGSKRNVGVSRTHVSLAALGDKVIRDKFIASKSAKAPVRQTSADKRREEAAVRKEQDKILRDQQSDRNASDRIREEARIKREADKEAKVRQGNVKAGRDPETGIKVVGGQVKPGTVDMPTGTVTEAKPPRQRIIRREPAAAADKSIEVIPTVYNGLLALYVNATDPDYKELVKKFGFKLFGEFVYADSVYIKDFYAHLDYLDKVFGEDPFDNASAARLTEIQNVFSESGRAKFLYPIAYKMKNEVVEFFNVRHRDSSKPNILKAYPAFLRDRMRMMIDLKTNPTARKLVGKVTPKTSSAKVGQWKLHPAMAINFVATTAEAKRVLKSLQQAGYTITNAKKVVEALADIKVRPQADEPKK